MPKVTRTQPRPPVSGALAPEVARPARAGARAGVGTGDTFTAAPVARAAATPPAASAPQARQVTFTYDAGSHRELTNLKLKGSFDKRTGQFDPAWGGGDAVPMTPLGDGRWQVTLPIADDGVSHDWRWGVIADGPTGAGQWAVMGEEPLRLEVGPGASTAPSYAPTTYDRMGAQRQPNGDLTFRFWAPDAAAVSAQVTDAQGRLSRFAMQPAGDGIWVALVPQGFEALKGLPYSYRVTEAGGAEVSRPDPYARQMQGEQRGLSREFLDLRTGLEVDPYFIQPELAQQLTARYGSWDAVPTAERTAAIAASRAELMRFEIDGEPTHALAELVLTDDAGHQLTRSELLARLGGPLDARMDPGLAGRLRGGPYDDLWSRNCADDGSIRLTDEDGTWTTFVSNPQALEGLHYELRCYDRDAQGQLRLVGDRDGDGVLSPAERAASAENDPWDDTLGPESGVSFRSSIISDPGSFQFQHDAAPRETDHARWIIEQVHVGSFLGSAEDSRRSTLQDLLGRLQHFKDLGVNTVELLPTNEVEGTRDWGYMGANSLATESSLGFEDADGRWVSGTEALQRFIDAAHGLGLNVLNDVVYNHVGGSDNFLWNLDGDANPYFNWATGPGQVLTKDTPWGAMPAYDNPHVKQFFVDHAVSQVAELHFDGLRFDFTQPMKDPAQGGQAGWDLLREINRQVHFFKPDAFTAAEQFGYDPTMTRPAVGDEQGGAGFDAQWYTQFQHRLVHDTGSPSILQQAVAGQRTDIDGFMSLLTAPQGLSAWPNAVTILSDHDEVGNGQRSITVANGGATGWPTQWARAADRFAAGIGFASPGIPMFFQGDESMAQNTFQWGRPDTWDLGWGWKALGPDWDWDHLTFDDTRKALYERLAALSAGDRASDAGYRALPAADRQVCDALCALGPEARQAAMLDIARKQTFRFYQEAIALRRENPAFDADASVSRVYTHDDDAVLAFERTKGASDFIVAGSLAHSDRLGYPLPLPPGKWQEVFNSDSARYGGGNVGNFGATLPGGTTPVTLPAGGYVVLKRVL
jgi:maltooligosyltrehalose trehalohydrolase